MGGVWGSCRGTFLFFHIKITHGNVALIAFDNNTPAIEMDHRLREIITFHHPRHFPPSPACEESGGSGGARSNKTDVVFSSLLLRRPRGQMEGKPGLPAPALITHRWLMLDLGSDAVPPSRHFLLWTNTIAHVRAPKHKSPVQQYDAEALPLARTGQHVRRESGWR